jgi:hypothetical protein
VNVPSIGGARGIFEVFVPGVFVLLNMGYVAYSLPGTDQNTRNLIAQTAANPASALIFIVSFGYLIGVLLRLLRTGLLDWLSGFANRILRPWKRREDKRWATDHFPYIDWVGRSCFDCLPADAAAFHSRVWAPRCRDAPNKQFFNFVKTVVACNDRRSAGEIYAAEAMSRYVACMFFALMVAFGLMVWLGLAGHGTATVGLVLVSYGIALVVIVWQFRSLRIKEAEAVFAASYKNRSLFEPEPAPEAGGAAETGRPPKPRCPLRKTRAG